MFIYFPSLSVGCGFTDVVSLAQFSFYDLLKKKKKSCSLSRKILIKIGIFPPYVMVG